MPWMTGHPAACRTHLHVSAEVPRCVRPGSALIIHIARWGATNNGNGINFVLRGTKALTRVLGPFLDRSWPPIRLRASKGCAAASVREPSQGMPVGLLSRRERPRQGLPRPGGVLTCSRDGLVSRYFGTHDRSYSSGQPSYGGPVYVSAYRNTHCARLAGFRNRNPQKVPASVRLGLSAGLLAVIAAHLASSILLAHDRVCGPARRGACARKLPESSAHRSRRLPQVTCRLPESGWGEPVRPSTFLARHHAGTGRRARPGPSSGRGAVTYRASAGRPSRFPGK